MTRFWTCSAGALIALLIAVALPTRAGEVPAAREVDFDRDVLPILAAKCLGCHSGPSPKARLDLLSRKNSLAGGRSGEPAVVPGKPEESLLIAAVSGEDADLRMPPRGAPLTAEETGTLRAWIRADARWSSSAEALIGKPWHWAYREPQRKPAPATLEPAWQKNLIDPFVLATLERQKLQHAPQATRSSLARRLSLAITGLLPAPEDALAFVADKDPAALEHYVDRLLASPQYGERMARLWLDLARYADTNGYEKDDRRSMWPWRDWVIEAFNQNMPFDRFTLEQMAGDLLPDATLDSRVATGFHRNTMINEEGGTDPEEFRVEAVHDRVHTTSSIFMGATLSCARCHDHKFDPFTIEDYYGVFAFFNGDLADTTIVSPSEQRAGGATVTVVPRPQRAAYADAIARRDAAEALIAKQSAELSAAQLAWESERSKAAQAWDVLKPTKMSAESGATLTLGEDGSIEVTGGDPSPTDTYRLEFALENGAARALRLELLPVPSSASHGVGRGSGGNVVLSEIGVRLVSAAGERGGPLRFSSAHADHEQRGSGEEWLARHAIDGNPASGWAVAPQIDRAHELVLEAEAPLASAAGTTLELTLEQAYGGAHTLARFRISASTQSEVALLAPLNTEEAAILAKSVASRSMVEKEQLAAHYRELAPALAGTRAQLAQAKADIAGITAASTLVLASAPMPRRTHVLRKGNFLDPGDEVPAALPAVFGALPDELLKNRLGFARWLASAKNPLFARVFVNYLWELDFGRGLVATLDDFGTQGEAPSHQELLDALALHFIDSGFDVKALQRLIVTSQTFLQASRMDEAAVEQDQANRWLARGPRFRLEAEALRDVALCASGLLERKIGGPSVFPPQPPGIWTMIYSSDQWTESSGPDRYRRGLYTFSRRTAPYPTSALFDAPSRETSCPRRSRTNTPLQALASLNDPQFVECAVALARRMLREATGTEHAVVQRGFALCLSRAAEPAELKALLALYHSQLETYTKDAAAAAALLANGPVGAPADSDPAAVAAWTVVANVLLNLDETLSLE